MDKYMKIADVPALTTEYDDYIFARSSFLDDFYKCDISKKAALLADEPESGVLKKEDYCDLAAAAHKLSVDFSLPVPEWTMKDDYIMPYPVYPHHIENETHRKTLREVSPVEYTMRNLFFGSKTLMRL